jgi:hypothetical protein
MNAAAEHCSQAKGQRSFPASNAVSHPKHYEDRADRALLYPTRNKRENWQSDFVGVVRLSATGKRYWVNLWISDPYRIRLSEKDGLVKSPVCRLSPVGPGRYTGKPALYDKDSSRQFLLRVWLHETDQCWLHFEVISQKRIEP